MTISRICALAAITCVATACDPILIRGLTVSPPPARTLEQTQEEAFTLAATVALAHDLRPGPAAPIARTEGWDCHQAEAIRLCGKPIADEVQFYFSEMGFSFSSRARSILAELTDRLTATFGAGAVRKCKWVRRPDPEAPEGERDVRRPVCVPVGGGS